MTNGYLDEIFHIEDQYLAFQSYGKTFKSNLTTLPLPHNMRDNSEACLCL